MQRSALPAAIIVLCVLTAPVSAQTGNKLPPEFAKRASVTVEVVPAKVKRGETVSLKLTVTPKPEAQSWTYPVFPKDTAQVGKTLIELPEPGALIFIGKVTDPQVKWKDKPRDTGLGTDQVSYEPVTWELKAVVSPKAAVGPKSLLLDTISLQVCDAKTCIQASGKKLPFAEFTVEDGESVNINAADFTEATKGAPPAPKPPDRGKTNPENPSTGTPGKALTRKTAKPTDAYAAEMKAFETTVVGAETPPEESLWAFVLTAAAWGLISLVTPCVFPMIPITVSIFLKQSHESFRERIKLAGVYSLTIILVLGLSAFTLLKFMALLSVHPLTNILLGALFLVLALSLFGMYDIGLPNALQRRLQAKQSKGGVVGMIFGALAFTVISFTCVAPFLGGFAGISAGGGGSFTTKEIAGGLAFATAFAAPFFILALVPGLMKALPRSGGWLDSVKVVMGFLELAAALKFLRTAELRLLPTTQYFTFDLVLGGWVAISFACGLYLLNVYRLPHDEEKPNIGVPRLLFALLFLGLALYLAPALLKNGDGKPQRPSGAVYAWVEAFLLPEPAQAEAGKDELWRTDLPDTIDAAKKSGHPIFVDFTGVTCTNCAINEHNVFPLPAVRDELQKFEKVKFYTDEVPESYYTSDPGRRARKEEANANGEFQSAVFKTIQLPLYAVLVPQPDGKVKVIGVYDEGKINDPARFVAFLKDSQEKAKKK